MDKNQLRIMALSERLMDEGVLPWVLAPSPMMNNTYERMPVTTEIMRDLGLKNGQRINSMIFEAITKASIEQLMKIAEDSQMDEDFDFRDYLKEEGDEG